MTKNEYIDIINAKTTPFKIVDLIELPDAEVDEHPTIIADLIALKQAITACGCERIGDITATIGLSQTRPWINSFAAAEYSPII